SLVRWVLLDLLALVGIDGLTGVVRGGGQPGVPIRPDFVESAAGRCYGAPRADPLLGASHGHAAALYPAAAALRLVLHAGSRADTLGRTSNALDDCGTRGPRTSVPRPAVAGSLQRP